MQIDAEFVKRNLELDPTTSGVWSAAPDRAARSATSLPLRGDFLYKRGLPSPRPWSGAPLAVRSAPTRSSAGSFRMAASL